MGEVVAMDLCCTTGRKRHPHEAPDYETHSHWFQDSFNPAAWLGQPAADTGSDRRPTRHSPSPVSPLGDSGGKGSFQHHPARHVLLKHESARLLHKALVGIFADVEKPDDSHSPHHGSAKHRHSHHHQTAGPASEHHGHGSFKHGHPHHHLQPGPASEHHGHGSFKHGHSHHHQATGR